MDKDKTIQYLNFSINHTSSYLYADAFRNAIIAVECFEEWTPFDEHPPVKNGRYLVCENEFGDECIFIADFRTDIGFYDYTRDDDLIRLSVDYWKHLPLSPRKDSKNGK